MKIKLLSLLLGFTAVVANAAYPVMTEAEKESDLNQLISLIRSGYGPIHYKENIGIKLDDLHEQYRHRAQTAKTNGEFTYLMRQLVAEFKDSHFGALVPTGHKATLGFTTDLVEGKILIDEINRKNLSEESFPFSRGDEVVSMDGRSSEELLNDLSRYVGAGFQLTARRSAAYLATSREGRVVPVPSGDVEVQIRRGTSSIIEKVKLKWIESGQPLDEADPVKLLARFDTMPRKVRNFGEISVADFIETYFGRQSERSFRCSGRTRIAIPKDAVMIMDESFVAYYHPTEKGNVGYLRIPHYSPKNEVTGQDEYALRFAQYEYAVSVLEKNTVGLIIDQDHNCGGNVDYLERIVGLFMNQSYQPMMFTLLANKQEYLEFSDWLNGLNANTLEYQNLKKVRQQIKDSWQKGEFMTPFTSISGVDQYQPNPIRYTKPIVMLIDEMSGSGGDAFPSLLQGYGRAKLLGTRTMGAGGHVTEQSPLFYSRLGIRMTKSLFFRPDGVAVENNGAVPDYPYTITRDDFIYGYKNYQAYYLKKLLELVGN